MSTINTNPINVNYPVPGVNNNSQGFRDNFASIVTNLNTAATEITDLQNKVVVKQALTNTTVNNDMGNTLISNASTRSFRATTYNMGNALSGTVLVNVSLGDVQYGTVAGNTTFNFGSWAPTGTQSNVTLQLAISNANAYISFSGNVILGNNYGASTLENVSNVGGLLTVTAPNGVSQLNYLISSVDCGNSLSISPINRPRQATQVQQRIVPPTGLLGDVAGDIALGPVYNQLVVTSSNGSGDFFTTTGTTTQLYPDLPIVFTGTSFEANVTSGTTYYVRNVLSNTTFTISNSIGGANANLVGGTGLVYANPVSYAYIATSSFDSNVYQRNILGTTATSNNITLDTTTSLVVNSPIIFGANVGGLYANTVYYIKGIASPNITVSQSRINGVAGTVVNLSTATGANGNAITTANVFVGNDIWQQIPLLPSVTPNEYTTLNVTSDITAGGNISATGNILSSGSITSNNTGGVGYSAGAGGTVTQTGSRTSGVTINKTTGAITLVSAAGSSSYASFTVTNSTVGANDVIIVNQKAGIDKYEAYVTTVAAGSFQITFADMSGTTVEQPVFSFAVIKGAVA